MQATLKLPLFLLLTLALAAGAAADNLSALDAFETFLGGAPPQTDLTLERAQIEPIAEGLREGSPEVGALLDAVESVTVRQYDLGEVSLERATLGIDEAGRQLQGAGWIMLADVKNEGDRVRVFLRSDGERIQGITAFFAGDSRAGYAQVVGDVSMAQIMTLVPQMQNLSGTLKGFLGG